MALSILCSWLPIVNTILGFHCFFLFTFSLSRSALIGCKNKSIAKLPASMSFLYLLPSKDALPLSYEQRDSISHQSPIITITSGFLDAMYLPAYSKWSSGTSGLTCVSGITHIFIINTPLHHHKCHAWHLLLQ